MIDRRRFLVGGAFSIAAARCARASARSPSAAIEADIGAIGVMARDTGIGIGLL